MKKNTFLIKSLFLGAALFFASNTQAQVELKILTEMGTRFSDVNDDGKGVTTAQYYDFATGELTPMEPEALLLTSINNDENVAGIIEVNSNMEAGYKINGEWKGVGFTPQQDPSNDQNFPYGISDDSRYITGQGNEGVNYGGFLFDTQTEELVVRLDPQGEAGASYGVNNNGIMVGWVDRPDGGGTLRVPAYITTDGEFHTIPENQSPTVSWDNAIYGINNNNVMVGSFDLEPFMYDLTANTFTSFEIPQDALSAAFSTISDNGVAVGYAEVDFQVRDAIIYHPTLGEQPLYLKDVLADNGITVDTPDGYLGTAISVSSNGKYIAGWLNGPPMNAEGWMVNLDDLILGTATLQTTTVSYYPNPVKDVLNLNTKEAISSVAVYNVTGQKVANVSISENNTQVDFSNLASGVYFVEVKSNGSVENLKVIKE
ncbi:T9SS type A sorting domain-containing protein [Aequorivita xiaoshiensis]|uniref:T9SS type A sorting domain-containing protein n=1 Tax=Aequorivita xiaoshiensis TaxID=2874476 RepID=A0A9X1R3C9_9FLAO|nr:T9SS type A sorting domain-containing protein [Aequorivita xiaoshiensis]MCG2430808.1 T9SS type A sorting domain-containing protein [Aequorivita xiaoshiensis]